MLPIGYVLLSDRLNSYHSLVPYCWLFSPDYVIISLLDVVAGSEYILAVI